MNKFVGVNMAEMNAGFQATLDLRAPLGENSFSNLGGEWNSLEIPREFSLSIQQWDKSGVSGERRKLRAIQMDAK